MPNQNQGEGNREADRAYREHIQQSKQTHDLDAKAKEAKRSIEGSERQELLQAEEKGRERAPKAERQAGQK